MMSQFEVVTSVAHGDANGNGYRVANRNAVSNRYGDGVADEYADPHEHRRAVNGNAHAGAALRRRQSQRSRDALRRHRRHAPHRPPLRRPIRHQQ